MNAATMDTLIEMADKHQAADEYVAGWYDFTGGGACSVGCSIHDMKKLGLLDVNVDAGSHPDLAAALGAPELMIRMCDHCFERMPEANRPAWTPRWLRALRDNPGPHDAKIYHARVAHMLLTDPVIGLAVVASRQDVRDNCTRMADLYLRRSKGDEPLDADWSAARVQVYAAWEQAYAAWRQADAAREQAEAAWRQADAARVQADAAWRQANAAWEGWWLRVSDFVIAALKPL